MKAEGTIMRKKRIRFFTGVLAAAMAIAMVGCSSEAESVDAQENTSDTAEVGIETCVKDMSTTVVGG